MFNLGYKEVVLNSALDASNINGTTDITIPGYATKLEKSKFKLVGGGTYAFATMHAAAVAGTASVVTVANTATIAGGGTLVAGDAVEVKVTLRSMRNSSDFARDFIKGGKTIVFSSTLVASGGTLVNNIATAVAAGYKSMFGSGNGEEFISVTAATANSVFTSNYDHVEITKVEYKLLDVSDPLPANTFVEVGSASTFALPVGKGSWVEESRRFATPQNVMPYNVQHGGNSQGVDVRGWYDAYSFEVEAPLSGWAPHEYVDHSHVSAEMATQNLKYVIYALRTTAPGGTEAVGSLVKQLDTFFA